MLLVAEPPAAYGVPYWVAYVLVGVLIVVISTLILTVGAWYRKNVLRTDKTSDLVTLMPQLRSVVRIVLGDSTTVPPQPGLLAKINKIYSVLNRLSRAIIRLEQHVGLDPATRLADPDNEEEMYDAENT